MSTHTSDIQRLPEEAVLTIFGASGDLSRRKLLPALFNLYQSKLLPKKFSVIGFSRTAMTDDAFRKDIEAALREFSQNSGGRGEEFETCLKEFVGKLSYLAGDYNEPSAYSALKEKITSLIKEPLWNSKRLFYLATPPSVFAPVAEHLGQAGLSAEENGGWARTIIEKPFGSDLESARELNVRLRKVLSEEQIYRIDHYLGKETVQNIIALRFANRIFEPVWNRSHVSSVQITVAEDLGVENRGDYYEGAGAMRDMVPNHLFQILSLIAMEPPSRFDAVATRNEYVSVLNSVVPLKAEDVDKNVVRGQYAAGEIKGRSVVGYRDEKRVAKDSKTETFFAMKMLIDNWRWAGVPFYLRTGKRMKSRMSEVSVRFKAPPVRLFSETPIGANVEAMVRNQLVLRLQPQETISLSFSVKAPGAQMRIEKGDMFFDTRERFRDERPTTGYETLLFDALIGDQTLYKRMDQVEAGWEIVAPVLKDWETRSTAPLASYRAGSWGPKEADELLSRDGQSWRNIE